MSEKTNETTKAKTVYRVNGMDCASCATTLEKRVSSLRGVSEVQVNFSTAKMSVVYEGNQQRLLHAVKQAGFTAEEQVEGERLQEQSFWKSHPKVIYTLISGLFFILSILLYFVEEVPSIAVTLSYAAAIIIGGYSIAYIGLTGLKTKTIGIEFLMTIAVIGAIVIGEWAEGAAVIFLFSLGETLEAYTMDRTRKSIRSLMKLTPAE